MEKEPHNFPSDLKSLVVDDHDLIRKSIAKVLRKLGFQEIIECPNGKEARIVLDTQSIDLVICDLNLNFVSGFELLDHLRSLDTGSDTPFMIVTGASDKDDIVKAANKGAEDYIVKPFTPEELEFKIVKVLNQYHSPGPVLGRIRQAERMIIATQFQEADQILTEALKIKETPRARHLQAVSLAKQKKNKEAVELLMSNLKSTPNFLRNYVTLANIHIENEDFKNAIQILSLELEINPKQPLRQIKLANMLLHEGNSLAAIEHFRQALLENNKSPEALYGMGVSYALADNIEKSIYYYKRYRRHHPKDSRPLKAVVQFAKRPENFRLVEVVLIDEKKSHPERMDTYVILADFYLKIGREEQALATLDAAIKRKPDYTPAHLGLARYYLKQKDYENAIATLEKLIAHSKEPMAFILLSQLYMQLKNYVQAMITLHQGMHLKLAPEKALPILLECSFKTKQVGKAAFIHKRMIQLKLHSLIPENMKNVEQAVHDRRKAKLGLKSAS